MTNVPEISKTASDVAKRATPPVPRPDRQFYAQTQAFGRFGMRWFSPTIMAAPHFHGHIELNWLTDGGMTYAFDSRTTKVPSQRLVMFWAGIPHQTSSLDRGRSGDSRQCNVYLPLDSFLHMPKLGRLTETMLAGGIIALSPETIGEDTLTRWYQDYRSGNVERAEILKGEIALMLRRAAVTGWDEILSPWIETESNPARGTAPLRYVVSMLRFILENLDQPLRAQDVARVVGLHPNYAVGIFSDTMRLPMHKFVVRMRLIRARHLLIEGKLSIENVAYRSGFASVSQFYEQFRTAYGLTPRQMQQTASALLE